MRKIFQIIYERNNLIKTSLILIVCISNYFVNAQNKTQQQSSISSKKIFNNTNITTKIVPGMKSTWGYDIYVDDKLMIHQPSIPAMPGNEGFKTKENAQKVANLVISKMKKGEMPPSVTVGEMKKLKTL